MLCDFLKNFNFSVICICGVDFDNDMFRCFFIGGELGCGICFMVKVMYDLIVIL